MEFKKITLDSIKELNKYIQDQQYRTCDYTVLGLYMWNNYYNTEYYIGEDFLLLRDFHDNTYTYYMPLGNLTNAFKALKELNKEFYIGQVTKDMLEDLSKYVDIISFNHIRDNDDYTYNYLDLKDLKGKKYEKKRNLIHQFRKLYSHIDVKPITTSLIPSLIEYQKVWASEFNDYDHKEESKGCIKVLENFDKLNLNGIVLYVDNKIVGYTVYEKLLDTLYCHIEKATHEYKGVYQFLQYMYFRSFEYNDITTVNREDDNGDEGLRKAKESYHPIMIEKHLLFVKSK